MMTLLNRGYALTFTFRNWKRPRPVGVDSSIVFAGVVRFSEVFESESPIAKVLANAVVKRRVRAGDVAVRYRHSRWVTMNY